MSKLINPFKTKIDYPSNRSDFRYVKEIQRYCFNHKINFNKRYLNRISLPYRLIKSSYSFLLGTEPE